MNILGIFHVDHEVTIGRHGKISFHAGMGLARHEGEPGWSAAMALSGPISPDPQARKPSIPANSVAP